MFSRVGNSKVYMDHNHRSSDLLLLTKTPAAAPQNTLSTVICWSFSFTCKILSFSGQANSMASGIQTACLPYRKTSSWGTSWQEYWCPCALWI